MSTSIANLNLTVFCLLITERHRRVLDAHRARHPAHRLWHPQVYELERDPAPPLDATWIAFDAESFLHRPHFARAIARRAGILKALDALLRYAFVASLPLEGVGALLWPGGTLAGLRAHCAGVPVELRLQRQRRGQPIVQAGDPRRWFDAGEWLDELRAAGGGAATRGALRFAESHRPLLLDLGAAEVTPARWVPGPGTSRADLAAVVWEQSRRARVACAVAS